MKELIMFVSASSVTCSSEQEVFLLTKGNVRQLLLQSSIIVDSRTANLPPIISFRFAVTERATKAHSNVDPVQSSSKQRRNSRTTRTEATQRSPVISVNTAARSSRPPTPWRDMSGMCTSCLSGAPVSAGPGGRATCRRRRGARPRFPAARRSASSRLTTSGPWRSTSPTNTPRRLPSRRSTSVTDVASKQPGGQG